MIKMRQFAWIVMVISFVFTNIQKVNSQKNFDLAVGIGIQEMAHVAVRYQLNQFKAGINIGSLPNKSTKSITYSGDVYYHFGGKSKYTAVRPWFVRSGLTCRRSEDNLSIINDRWIYLRAGRDFNLSKKLGISIDAGLSKRLTYKEEFKRPTSSWKLFDFTEWPSGAFEFYYRF